MSESARASARTPLDGFRATPNHNPAAAAWFFLVGPDGLASARAGRRWRRRGRNYRACRAALDGCSHAAARRDRLRARVRSVGARSARERRVPLAARAARGCGAYRVPRTLESPRDARRRRARADVRAPARARVHARAEDGRRVRGRSSACAARVTSTRAPARPRTAGRTCPRPSRRSSARRAARRSFGTSAREGGEMWRVPPPVRAAAARARHRATTRPDGARRRGVLLLQDGRRHAPAASGCATTRPTRAEARSAARAPHAVLAGSPNPLKTYADLPGISGCQTKMVLGFECARDLAITEAARAEAVRRLREDFAFVGLQEQWESSVELLWRMFGVPGAPRPGVDTATDTHYRQGSYNRTQARRDLARYSDPDDETIFEEARALLIWRCNAFGVEIAEPWGAPTYVNAARRLKRSLRVPVDDPREDARCRGVWNRAVTERGGAIADERDRIWVREDLRAKRPASAGSPSRWSGLPIRRPCAETAPTSGSSSCAQAASRTLGAADPRRAGEAHAAAAVHVGASAASLLRNWSAPSTRSAPDRDVLRRRLRALPHPAEHAICSLPFARAGAGEDEDGRWASRSALLANFIQFVDGMLFDGAFEDLARDGISYHVFSQMYSLRRRPSGSTTSEGRRDRRGDSAPAVVGFRAAARRRRGFRGLVAVEGAAEARDHKGGSASSSSATGPSSPSSASRSCRTARARASCGTSNRTRGLRYSQSGSDVRHGV